jgi:parallel beta-helix repeat protein
MRYPFGGYIQVALMNVKNLRNTKSGNHYVVLLILILVLSQVVKSQTIVPGGYVSGTWDLSGSPYLIEDDILIHPDSTLSIDAGAQVLFGSKKLLEIQGQLLVYGNINSPVLFDGDTDTTTWYGLFFNATDTSITDSSILEHGQIRHCFGHPAISIEQSGRIRISAFTIRDNTAFRGAGINCVSSDPYFQDLHVLYNHSLDGAGISLENSSPAMTNCTVGYNVADGAGGGMVIFSNSNPVITNNNITGNQSFGSGGGIYINDADPVFRYCNISLNLGATGSSTMYSGGGVSVKLASHPVFENCIFENNQSFREGGGIASFSENEIVNSLFKENSALVKGGAAYLASSNLISSRLTNCTFSDNDSPQGTALAILNNTGIIRNCILWHTNPVIPGSLIHLEASFGWNVMNAAFSDIQNSESGIETEANTHYTWGPGNIDLDPVFLPDTGEPSWKSPCIEAGTIDTSGLSLPDYDLAGNPRIVNDRVDMGAYEYQLPLGIPNSRFQIPKDIRIFPNPSRDWVCFEMIGAPGETVYELTDSRGDLVRTGNINARQYYFKINILELPAGLYFIMISGENFRFSRKVVILD